MGSGRRRRIGREREDEVNVCRMYVNAGWTLNGH
jgi:hypothetical protein